MKDIYIEGIEKISPIDIQYAKNLGYVVKLLAIAKRDGNKIEARVHPTLLPLHDLLSSVSGVYNAIFIDTDLVGRQVYYGAGAGKLPTASAVIGDIMDIASGLSFGRKSTGSIFQKRVDVKDVKKMDDVRTKYYVHFSTSDTPGVLAKIADAFGRRNISIARVVQEESQKSNEVPIVMLTHEAREKDMQLALKEINKLGVIKRKTVLIRIES
jgi:homoserine dehydrogenase